jgi:hypothetical protein
MAPSADRSASGLTRSSLFGFVDRGLELITIQPSGEIDEGASRGRYRNPLASREIAGRQGSPVHPNAVALRATLAGTETSITPGSPDRIPSSSAPSTWLSVA